MAGRYERSPEVARREDWVLAPGRDTLSGAPVSVLEGAVAPQDAEVVAERLQQWSRVRHDHLVEVRAVDALGDQVRVVCEPLRDLVSLDSLAGTDLTVRGVQQLSAQLLGALAALHRAGLVHGAVSGRSVLVPWGTNSRDGDPGGVTLLPLPAPQRPGPAEDEAPRDLARLARGHRSGDVAAAAAMVRELLDGALAEGLEEAVLAASLRRQLEKVVTTDGDDTPGA